MGFSVLFFVGIHAAESQAPLYLAKRVDELGAAFKGRVGIAVRSADDGWETGWREDDLYPQQSVSKMWVAITALDAADRGKVRMSETVNLASRMQTQGEPNRIQISQQTYELVSAEFACEARGTVEIKGMGSVRTYWLCPLAQ